MWITPGKIKDMIDFIDSGRPRLNCNMSRSRRRKDYKNLGLYNINDPTPSEEELLWYPVIPRKLSWKRCLKFDWWCAVISCNGPLTILSSSIISMFPVVYWIGYFPFSFFGSALVFRLAVLLRGVFFIISLSNPADYRPDWQPRF